MSSIARNRRSFAAKAAAVLCLIAITTVAAAAAFGPQTLSLERLFKPFIGAAAPAPAFREVEPQLHAEAPAPMSMPSGTLATPRSGHTATLLDDGRVLIVGGSGDTSAEIVDGGTVSATGNTNHARSGHTATRLSDGRVLIAGGGNITSEIYDPATGTFSLGPDMTASRSGHTATASGNNVIITGGGTDSVEVFNGTNFGSAGSLTQSRTNHSAISLNDGRVFIAGGDGLDTAEIYNSADGTSAATGNPLAHQRSRAHLRVLPDGKVQIIGGNDDVSMEVYDPAIDTVGAHVHLLPDTDTCTGLRNGVRDSQTRAALFFAGNADAAYDRTGHTITEVSGNQALVVGGTTGGSATNSVTTFASSPATITTDKLDYAPGETVTFSGTGFAPNETVRVVIHEDPHTHLERNFEATADPSGNITGSYLVEEHDLNVKFIVNARGLTSNLTAQTAFTDGLPQQVDIDPTSVTVAQGQVASYAINVDMGGNAGACTITLSVTTTLPSGTTATFLGGNPINLNPGNVDFSRTLQLATSGTTPVGSYPFTVRATPSSCQSGAGTREDSGTLVVNAGTVETTTTVSSSSNPSTYGQPVTFTATVARSSGSGTPTGSVNFNIAGIGTVAGTPGATTSTTATWTYTTEATALSAGNHSVTADYSPSGSFTASSGELTGGQTVNPAPVTATAGGGSATYDGNTKTPSACAITGPGYLGDLTCANDPATVGPGANTYTIEPVVSGTGLSNFDITEVNGSYVINKADATIVVTPYDVFYDGQPHTATGTATGADGSDLSGLLDLSGTTHTNAGAYPGDPWTFAGDSNHNPDSGTVDNNIKKAPVTATAGGGSATYDGNTKNPSACAITGPGFLGDLTCANDPATVGPGANTYTIEPVVSGTGLSNFDITEVNGTYTIEKRLATWTTNPNSKTYGDPDPAGLTTGSGSNFVAADNVTATYSRVAGENASPPTYHITATLSATPMSALDNYTITNNGAEFTIGKRTITVTLNSGQFKPYGVADPVLTYTFLPTPLPFGDTFSGSLSRDPGEIVGLYNITQGTLALNPNNYTLVFTSGVKFEIKTIYCFDGFHSPVGGSVESGNGGSFANPVRTFKLNSTIPFKFTLYNVGSCTGTPITTGVHTLRMIKYSNSTDSDMPIDATPTDAATTGNQFRLTGTDWHFNLDTKKTPGLSAGTWLAEATLQDGSKKTVWIAIKK